MSGPRRKGRRCDHSNLCKNYYTRACKKVDCKSVQECEHRPAKYHCLDCNAQRLCKHGSRVTECVDCGGIGICVHRKRRYICKECGGGSICLHKKQRSQCSECQNEISNLSENYRPNVSNIEDQHLKPTKSKKRRLYSNDSLKFSKDINFTTNKKESEQALSLKKTLRDNQFVDFNWMGLCNHEIPSSNCDYMSPEKKSFHGFAGYDYGKFSICIHKRLRYYCTECGGLGLCDHNKRRYECPHCEGPIVQMKRRLDGLKCGDSSVLVNVDYGKISICKHKMLRYYCLDCEGGGICLHKKRKELCFGCREAI